jgi:hypothetical protein
MEIFSALRGEENPKTANQEIGNSKDADVFCSPFLPEALSSIKDDTLRKRLFQGNHTRYVGLPASVKADILKSNNKKTFTVYCDLTYSDTATKQLCKNLGITYKPRDILFAVIFDQFIEFAKSPHDDVDSVMEKHEITDNNNLPDRNLFFSGRSEKLESIEKMVRQVDK